MRDRAQRYRNRISPLGAAVITIVLLLIVVFFSFSKQLPFRNPYEIKAVFESSVNMRTGSPVRIAGVNIGKVKKVERFENSDAAIVTMEISEDGRPVHKDAEAKIRPRLFLEGNWFVDLKPGTPSAPELDDGEAIGLTQTAIPVQLDQVLTSLQSDTRDDLQNLIDGYGTGLTHEPTLQEDIDQDPEVRGKTGAQAINLSLSDSAQALKGVAIVTEALQGTEVDDLSRLIAELATISKAIASRDTQLEELVVNFNTTLAATAAAQANLSLAIQLLPGVLRTANTTLRNLNRALPITSRFALTITPGINELGGTINASFPWIATVRRWLNEGQLIAFLRELQPTIEDTAQVAEDGIDLLGELNLVDRCLVDVVLPTTDEVLEDGPHTTGKENFKELFYGFVGLSGEGETFDGNGMYVRLHPGGGTSLVKSGPVNTGVPQMFANASSQPLGTSPQNVDKLPPHNSSVPCFKSQVPNVNGPGASGPPDAPVTGGISSANKQGASKDNSKGNYHQQIENEPLTGDLVGRLDPKEKDRDQEILQ